MEDLLKKGAYGAIMDEDDDANKSVPAWDVAML